MRDEGANWSTTTDGGRGTGTRTDALDGHPRRGISVVAASSEVLVHTSRRHDGAWTQRHGHGLPVSDLLPDPGDGTIGTKVTFTPRPDPPGLPDHTSELCAHLDTLTPPLTVDLHDHRHRR